MVHGCGHFTTWLKFVPICCRSMSEVICNEKMKLMFLVIWTLLDFKKARKVAENTVVPRWRTSIRHFAIYVNWLTSVFTLQGTASEATLVALLSARAREIFKYKKDHPDKQLEDGEIMSKFVAYSSDQVYIRTKSNITQTSSVTILMSYMYYSVILQIRSWQNYYKNQNWPLLTRLPVS
jgi:hypothetical protein